MCFNIVFLGNCGIRLCSSVHYLGKRTRLPLVQYFQGNEQNVGVYPLRIPIDTMQYIILIDTVQEYIVREFFLRVISGVYGW